MWHYQDKLMGDSPELQPLESNLFCDQIEKVAWLLVTTAKIEGNNKYSMTMPDKVFRTMVAAWDLVLLEQTVADIHHFRMALDAIIDIIAANGAYMSDFNLCNGYRRAMQRLV